MASEAEPLAPLLSALGDLATWLQTGPYRGIVIGGVAASLLGRPRITRDVDALVLIDESRWPEFIAAGARFGFVPRVPDFLAFARKGRVLLFRHEPSQIETDISLGALPFEEEAVARAQSHEVRGIALPLPSPEDLVIMKTIAHRPRDLGDIVGIVDAHPKLDWRRVRRWVRDFAAAMEMPELPRELEKLFPQRRKKKKGKRSS
jgi:hypothetical protein